MKKRIIAFITALFFLVPGMAEAVSVTAPEDFFPGTSMITADFSLTGKLKTILEPFIRSSMGRDEKRDVVLNRLLEGKTFSMSLNGPEDIIVSIPISDEEWTTLIGDDEKHEYGGVDIYTDLDSASYFAKLGEFAVLTPNISLAPIHQAIDTANGSSSSLSANESYKSVAKNYFSPRLFSFTLNAKELLNLVKAKTMLNAEGSDAEKGIQFLESLFDLFEFEGGSFAEKNDGYAFNIAVKGNAERLKAEGMSLNPGGNFIPNLYNKFPKARPIFYAESFNPKANFAQSKKITQKLFEQLGEKDIYALLQEEFGIDLEKFYAPFEKEFAFGIQYDQNSQLPYFTMLANISGARDSAKKIGDDLVNALTNLLEEGDPKKSGYTIEKKGDMTKFMFSVKNLTNDHDSPPFSLIALAIGLTEDDLFVISTYPDIENADKRRGFAADSDFGSFAEVKQSSTGIVYFNMRSVWGYVDSLIKWLESAGTEFAPDVDFYQGYYSVLKLIYGWRDVMLVLQGSESEALMSGKVTIDSAKHSTYEQFISALKSSDRDGDSATDYDELFVYKTPVDSGDSDHDGVSDIEELKKGNDPFSEAKLFTDLPEESYYTSDVSFLQQRGIVAGYPDKSFKAGNFVKRDEFVAMVMKAFEESGGGGVLSFSKKDNFTTSSFADLHDPNAWYFGPVNRAYRAGFVSGSMNQSGKLVFRPEDNITRAEALAILNKASEALNKTGGQYSCAYDEKVKTESKTEDVEMLYNGTSKLLMPVPGEFPFKDVTEDDWFCNAVANGYANGITKGKTSDQFRPHDYLNRAEAAVMIRRALEKDIKGKSERTESFGELSQPLAKELLPLVPTLR